MSTAATVPPASPTAVVTRPMPRGSGLRTTRMVIAYEALGTAMAAPCLPCPSSPDRPASELRPEPRSLPAGRRRLYPLVPATSWLTMRDAVVADGCGLMVFLLSAWVDTSPIRLPTTEGKPMAFTSWRGTMGLIKPTHRPGSLEETIRLLPEGIGVIPMTVGISRGDTQEFRDVLDPIEDRVRQLAEIGVDLIAPAGAPPFMVHGYQGERDILDRWERTYG